MVALASSVLPDRWIFRSPFGPAYPVRVAEVVRMAYYTAAMALMGVARWATDGRSSPYVYVLWHLPLATSFPYFLLLRDTDQHINADEGRLTNTRAFFHDPLTRWAVFVYGQDKHVPHHLFPVVPHYRLGELHALLKERHEEYAREVVEVHGTFANDRGLPTVRDILTTPRQDGAKDESRPVGIDLRSHQSMPANSAWPASIHRARTHNRKLAGQFRKFLRIFLPIGRIFCHISSGSRRCRRCARSLPRPAPVRHPTSINRSGRLSLPVQLVFSRWIRLISLDLHRSRTNPR